MTRRGLTLFLLTPSVAAESIGSFAWQAWPPGGSVVATNTVFFVTVPDPATVTLVDDGAALIDFDVSDEADDLGQPIRRLTPRELLRPDSHYRLLVPNGDVDRLLTDVTTGSGPDNEAPAPPALTLVRDAFESGGSSGGRSPEVRFAFSSAGNEQIFSVRLDEEPSYLVALGEQGFPANDILGISGPPGVHVVRVVALDDAANRSLPLVMTLDFCVAAGEPLGTSGPVILCEQGEGEGGEGEGGCAEGGMGAGVALLVLVRRRSGEARRG